MSRLYVGNLAHDTTDAQLRAAFAPHCQVTSVKVAADRRGRPKGFAYVDVDVADSDSVDELLSAIRGTQINGRTMDIVRDDPWRGGGPPRGGGRRRR
jgi:RNA recognition motif-containing protein